MERIRIVSFAESMLYRRPNVGAQRKMISRGAPKELYARVILHP
ncbi:MAG: hypothetical protein BECKG1743D_GA0114223_100136 [Candidatus Kentron sp. G]|nr:MAG: hypothetical protein BECKG1743E_GA0114224_100105 [Candidatus Kentron sp. G]VFM96490.1 MAG: hypothetical protein BECKG1743F_GA0114225_101622 [Candidatus Kentron sp. G]VFM97453.1 MAG: hypothetical protein BECKG1743D_GA0114223_100136 [Candidatus Kentron sp. G]